MAALAAVAIGAPARASAQDLFELEVFEFETTAPGTYAVGLHTNGVPQPDRRLETPASAHHPVHVSVEVTRGWTERLDTALFVQTAPLGPSQSRWFAGGHLRTKVRFVDGPELPFRLAVSAEYGFNRSPFDDELQTVELTPILDRRIGRLALIANPSVEFVTGGDAQGIEPTFDLAARAAWSVSPSLSLAVDYFSRPGTTRHLDLDEQAHHLIFSTMELTLQEGWTISFGAGHCVTSSEPWIVRSVVGFRFGR
jgi:hypothetical protein